jgi:hypothetical protein
MRFLFLGLAFLLLFIWACGFLLFHVGAAFTPLLWALVVAAIAAHFFTVMRTAHR